MGAALLEDQVLMQAVCGGLCVAGFTLLTFLMLYRPDTGKRLDYHPSRIVMLVVSFMPWVLMLLCAGTIAYSIAFATAQASGAFGP